MRQQVKEEESFNNSNILDANQVDRNFIGKSLATDLQLLLAFSERSAEIYRTFKTE